MQSNGFPSDIVALDDILKAVAQGIVSAQGEMDKAALSTTESSLALPSGEVHLRPVWFVFERTTLDLEFSTFMSGPAGGGTQFQCRPLDPAAVALRGHAASSGARLHIEIAPLGSGIIRRHGGDS